MIREDDDNNSEPEFVTHEDVKHESGSKTNNTQPSSASSRPSPEKLPVTSPIRETITVSEDQLSSDLSKSQISEKVKESALTPNSTSPMQSAARCAFQLV